MEQLSVSDRNVFIHKLFKNMIEIEDLRSKQCIINKSENNKVAVIIEPRKHEFLEEVVRNVMYFLPNGEWNLHIVTYSDNIEWVQSLFPNWQFKITSLDVPNLNLIQYTELLTSKQFWNLIDEENILIFQTDVMLFHSNINDFLEYDFIGANFFDEDDISKDNGGNNGGFSFRHKSAMLECIEKVSVLKVQQYQQSLNKRVKYHICEDVYFTIACEILGKRMCQVNERKKFSIEDGRKESYLKPLGCHRFASCEFAYILNDVLNASIASKWLPK